MSTSLLLSAGRAQKISSIAFWRTNSSRLSMEP